MSNFLQRLEIDMEKKLFSFLLIFLIIFIGIDIVVIFMITINGFWVIYYYVIPLLIILIFAGLIVDKRRRALFILLLIPEGLLTFVLGFVSDASSMAILWAFIGVFSGFTIIGMLAFFADVTTVEHRGKVAGLIGGIAWIVAGVMLSWYSSIIFTFTANIVMIVFAIIKLIGGVIAIYLLFKKFEPIGETTTSTSTGRAFIDTLKDSYSFIWGNSTFRTYLIAFFLIWLAQGIFLPYGGLGQEAAQNYQQMASIGFAAGGLFLIVGGFMLDKGRKQIAFYGALLAAISFVSYYFPIGAVFLAGIPILIITIIIILGDIAPSDIRGRFYSVFFLFSFIAFFIGLLIGTMIAKTYPAVTGNPYVALVCLILTVVAVLFIFIWGKESNITEVSFTEQGVPISAFKASPAPEPSPPKSTLED